MKRIVTLAALFSVVNGNSQNALMDKSGEQIQNFSLGYIDDISDSYFVEYNITIVSGRIWVGVLYHDLGFLGSGWGMISNYKANDNGLLFWFKVNRELH